MYLEKCRLDGKNAIVTGGGRGIGFAIAQALGEAGAKVLIAEILEDNGRRAAEELRGKGLQAEFRPLDVTKPEEVNRFARQTEAEFGPVDVLVNNAGMARNFDALSYTDDEYEKLMDINLHGVFYCCRAFGKSMVERKTGSVVNLGSMSGIVVNKPQPQAPYNLSKAAVHMLTKSLACEWASANVRVNAVAPGYIETAMTEGGRMKPEWNSEWLRMTPLGRHGRPDEIASAVLFLASDASSFCTGTILTIDGGYTSW